MKARSLLALAVLMTAAGMIAASLFAAEPKAEGKAETKAPGKDVKCPVSGKAVTSNDWLDATYGRLPALPIRGEARPRDRYLAARATR